MPGREGQYQAYNDQKKTIKDAESAFSLEALQARGNWATVVKEKYNGDEMAAQMAMRGHYDRLVKNHLNLSQKNAAAYDDNLIDNSKQDEVYNHEAFKELFGQRDGKKADPFDIVRNTRVAQNNLYKLKGGQGHVTGQENTQGSNGITQPPATPPTKPASQQNTKSVAKGMLPGQAVLQPEMNPIAQSITDPFYQVAPYWERPEYKNLNDNLRKLELGATFSVDDKKNFVFNNPEAEEANAVEGLMGAMRELIKRKGKFTKEDQKAIESFLANDMMGEAEDEGFIDALNNIIDSPGSHMQWLWGGKNVDNAKQIMDMPEYGRIRDAYVGKIATIRGMQGIINKHGLKPDQQGRYYIHPTLLSENNKAKEAVTNAASVLDIVHSGLKNLVQSGLNNLDVGLLGSGLQQGVKQRENQAEHLDNPLGTYLLRPEAFVRPGTMANRDIKNFIMSRLTPEQKTKVAQGTLDNDVLDHVLADAPPLIASMVAGPLRAGSSLSAGTMNMGRRFLSTNSMSKGRELAQSVINRMGVGELTQLATKTPGGAKALNLLTNGLKMTGESALETALTFTYAAAIEHGTELTPGIALESAKTGAAFGATGAIFGAPFAALGARATKATSAYKKLLQADRANAVSGVAGAEGKAFDAGMELMLNKGRQIGFFLGQIPANVGQGVVVDALNNPDFEMWSNPMKAGMVRDAILGFWMQPKMFKQYKANFGETKDFAQTVNAFADHTIFQSEVKKHDEKYAAQMADSPDAQGAASSWTMPKDAPATDDAGKTVLTPDFEVVEPQYQKVSVSEFAKQNNVSRQTAHNWIKQGRVRAEDGPKGKVVLVDEPIVRTGPDEIPIPKSPFADMTETTVAEVASKIDFTSDPLAEKLKARIETIKDIPVIFDDSENVSYDTENKVIHAGRRALGGDPRLAGKRLVEEIGHAMTYDVLQKNPELRTQVEKIIKAITDDKDVQRELKADRTAAIKRGAIWFDAEGKERGSSILDYYLGSPEEFVGGLATGELAGLRAIVDKKFGEGAFRGMLGKLSIDRLLGDVSPMFRTADSIDALIDRIYAEAKPVEPTFDTVTDMNMDAMAEAEGLYTWRSAQKNATLKGERPANDPVSIKAFKDLTDLALVSGLPEAHWLKVAQNKVAPQDWAKMSPAERAIKAKEMAVLPSLDNASAFAERLEKIAKQAMEQEQDVSRDPVGSFIRSVGNNLGFDSSRNARAWIIKNIESQGYEGTYAAMRQRYDQYKASIPDVQRQSYDEVFDKAYSQLMLQMGNLAPVEVVDVYQTKDQDGKTSYQVRPKGVEHRPKMSTLIYARKTLVDQIRNAPYSENRSIHQWFLEGFEAAPIVTSDTLPEAAGGIDVDIRSVRSDLRFNGYYLAPRGFHGNVMFNMDKIVDHIIDSSNNETGGKRDENGKQWYQRPENFTRMVKSLEDMIWWRVLDSDSRWDAGTKPDMKFLAGLDLHAVLDDFRKNSVGERILDEYFLNKSEAFKAQLEKNKDQALEDIRRVGYILDQMMTSQGNRMAPWSDTKTVQELAGLETDFKVRFKTALQPLMDQMMTLMVDPGAKTFVNGGKMAAKYFSHLVGRDYKSYTSPEHIDAILKGTSHNPISDQGLEGDAKDAHDRYLQGIGVLRGQDGRMVNRMVVINDQMAAMIPGLAKMLGDVPASAKWDGATMYINSKTRDLHAGMLGYEGSEVAGVKPAWYDVSNGSYTIHKTGNHSTFLHVMENPEENRDLSIFLNTLAQQGVSMVTFESAIKSDGNYRDRVLPLKDGTAVHFDDKGRPKAINQNGKIKKLNDEEATKYNTLLSQELIKGNIAQTLIRDVPLYGDDGLRLVNVSKKISGMNGVPLGTNDLPASLPGDILGEAYKLTMPMVRARNREAVDTYVAARKLASGEMDNFNLFRDKGAANVFQTLRQRLSNSENNTLGEGYEDPITQMQVLNRLDALVDAEGNVIPERMKAFNAMHPGVFQRKNEAVPSMVEYIAANSTEDAVRQRMEGAGSLWLQPVGTPMTYLKRGMEYSAMLGEEASAKAAWLKEMMDNGGVDPVTGVQLPPYYVDGKEAPNHPYVFVTQDYLDNANENIIADNERNKTNIPLLSTGSKALLVLTPSDSGGSVQPVIIAGIMPGVKSLSGNDDIIRKIMGRDFDADGIGLGHDSYHWVNSDGVSNFEAYWAEIYKAQIMVDPSKPIEPELKLGKGAAPQDLPTMKPGIVGEVEPNTPVRAVDYQGKPLGYSYKPNKPTDYNYGDTSIRSNESQIGLAMNSQRSTVAAMRMQDVLGRQGAYGDENGNLQVTFGHNPKMSSQLSVWRQNLVDAFDNSSYNDNDLFMSSVITDLKIKGRNKSYGELTGKEQRQVNEYFKRFVAQYGVPYTLYRVPKNIATGDVDPASPDIADARMFDNVAKTPEAMVSDNISQYADFWQQSSKSFSMEKAPQYSSRQAEAMSAADVGTAYRRSTSKNPDYLNVVKAAEEALPLFTDYTNTIIRAGGVQDHGVFQRALAGDLTIADMQVNNSVLSSMLRGGFYDVKSNDGRQITDRIRVQAVNNELFLQWSDEAGQKELALTHAFDSKGEPTQELTNVAPDLNIRQVMDAIFPAVRDVTLDNRGNRITKLADSHPDNFYVSFDSGTYVGKAHTRPNSKWVAKPGSDPLVSRGRTSQDVLNEFAQWKAQHPNGKVVFNRNYRAGEYPEDMVTKFKEMFESAYENPQGMVRFRRMDKEQKAILTGRIAGSIAQATADNPVKASLIAGDMIARGMESMAKEDIRGSFNAYMNGAHEVGVIPRHYTGQTMESFVHDMLVRPDPAVDTKTVLPESSPVVETVERNMPDGTVLHTWRSSPSKNKGPIVVDQAVKDLLKAKGIKRLEKAMDVLRVASGQDITDWTLSDYNNMYADIQKVFHHTFDEQLGSGLVDKMLAEIDPSHMESYLSSLTMYADPVAQKTAMSVGLWQALLAGREAVRDVKSVLGDEEASEFKKKMALRFQNFFNPFRGQSDADLNRMASRYRTFRGVDIPFDYNVGMQNGVATGSQAVTMDMLYDKFLHVRKNIAYDAAPNIEYLMPQSSLHMLKDTAQLWLKQGLQQILSMDNTKGLNKGFWKKTIEEFYNTTVDTSLQDYDNARTMAWVSRAMTHNATGDKVDFSKVMTNASFDGTSTAGAVVSYDGEAFQWSGRVDDTVRTGVARMVAKMIANGDIVFGQEFGKLSPQEKVAAEKAVSRALMTQVHDKVLAQYLYSMAQKHSAWWSMKSQMFNGDDEMKAHVGSYVMQNVKKLQELADELHSDDQYDHMRKNIRMDKNHLGDLITRWKQDMENLRKSGSVAEADALTQGLYDVTLGRRDKMDPNKTRVMNTAIDDIMRDLLYEQDILQAPIMGSNIQPERQKSLGEPKMALVYEALAEHYGEKVDFAISNRQALIESAVEDTFFGINDAMKTAYMAEYGHNENMIARNATLSRFDLDGNIYDRPINPNELANLVSEKGRPLTEAETGLQPGQAIAVQYTDQYGRIVRNNVRYFGTTTIKTTPLKNEVITTMLKNIEGKTLTPDEAEWKAQVESEDFAESIPAMIAYKLDPIEAKGKMVMIPLKQMTSLAAGAKLGNLNARIDGKIKEHAQEGLDALRGAMAEEFGDPVEALGREFTKFIAAHPEDPDATVGVRFYGNKVKAEGDGRDPRKVIPQTFFREMGYNDLSAGHQKIVDALQASAAGVSRWLYGGMKHVTKSLVGAAIFPFDGGIMLATNLSKMILSHAVHYYGNKAGGKSRAWMLNLGLNAKDMFDFRDPEVMTAALAASTASRFGKGAGFLNDQMGLKGAPGDVSTAELEKRLVMLNTLKVNGILEQDVDMSPDNARKMVEERIQQVYKDLSQFRTNVTYDPHKKTSKVVVTDKSGRTLSDLENMNLDAINRMLTFVQDEQANKIKNILRTVLKAGTLPAKRLNKLNSSMFYSVGASEYSGAIQFGGKMEPVYDRVMAEAGTRLTTNSDILLDKTLRMNYLRVMQDQILGKFDERNPYHNTMSGRLATLFSQWGRNYFRQSTEGIQARQAVFSDIMKELHKDPKYAKRMQDLGILTAGGLLKDQKKAIFRSAAMGTVVSLPALVSASIVAANLGLIPEDWKRYAKKFEYESGGDLQLLNRIMGFDNLWGTVVAGGTMAVSAALNHTLSDKELTPAESWKMMTGAMHTPFGAVSQSGIGVYAKIPYDMSEVGLLSLYLAATNSTEEEWARLMRMAEWKGASVMTVTPGTAPVGQAMDVYNSAKKSIEDSEKDDNKSTSKKRSKY